MSEKIIYHMATMPFARRPEALKEVVPRILPQCDELHIYLNNYETIRTNTKKCPN